MFKRLLKCALATAAAAAFLAGCRSTESNALTRSENQVGYPAAEAVESSSDSQDPVTEMDEIFYADWLPDLGKAPEINNPVWINSEPLSMAELEGKVVLVEFWTFG